MSDRFCFSCDAEINDRSPRFRTCGHPRCVRHYRNSATKSTRKRAEWAPPDVYAPDTSGRRAILRKWAASSLRFGDQRTSERVTWVADATSSTPATVLSVVASEAP